MTITMMKNAMYAVHVYKDDLTIDWLVQALIKARDGLHNATDINIIDHGNEWEFVVTYQEQVKMSNEELVAKTIQYYKLKQELGL